MAVIHHTTVKPTKLELLASWLPSRPWYEGADDLPPDTTGHIAAPWLLPDGTPHPRGPLLVLHPTH